KLPFGRSLFEWSVKELLENKQLYGYVNVMFNPVSVEQLAIAIEKIIELDFNGIMNIAANDIVSKFDFIVLIRNLLNNNLGTVTASNLIQDMRAVQRPLNTSLNTEKMSKTLGLSFSLESGLKDTLLSYFITKYLEATRSA
ncbi:MAG: Rossmann-fold NAD(P)-binding domain-containing protein, partial [Mobilitalea sp.]